MSPNPRIQAFAGSTREDSYNKTLVRIAARAAEQAGAEVNVIDLRDYPLPIFDEDLEKSGTPENARKLTSSVAVAEAVPPLNPKTQRPPRPQGPEPSTGNPCRATTYSKRH